MLIARVLQQDSRFACATLVSVCSANAEGGAPPLDDAKMDQLIDNMNDAVQVFNVFLGNLQASYAVQTKSKAVSNAEQTKPKAVPKP